MSERVAFGPLEIEFDERVPRPQEWTTRQSVWAANLLADAPEGSLLDLCCGAGQVGLLAARLSHRSLVCIDVDAAACEYARRNASTARLTGGAEVREGRLEEALRPDEQFPVVLAAPPDHLAASCLAVAGRHLAPAGSVLVQLETAAQAERLAGTALPRGLRVETTTAYDGQGVIVRLTATTS